MHLTKFSFQLINASAGKLTTAIAVARHAAMTLHWTTGVCAPFQVNGISLTQNTHIPCIFNVCDYVLLFHL